MAPQSKDSKDRIKKRDSNAVAAPTRTAPQKGSEKPGFMSRFLKWIARGADRSRVSGGTCPT